MRIDFILRWPKRPILMLWLLLCTTFALSAQVISTQPGIGTRAQLLKHLDALENTPEVKSARHNAQQKGNPETASNAPQLPEESQLGRQIQQALGILQFPYDPKIKEFILIYADAKRRNSEAMLGMATLYLPGIELRLREANLPPQLAMLPAALSAFNPNAIDANGRAGLWQLNFQVALRYGLACDENVDERRDPFKSSVAALAYLSDLKNMYKDWPTAIAAYTAGPAGITRARNRAGQNAGLQQLVPFLPSNVREDLLAFAAAAYVVQNAASIGLQALQMETLPQLDRIQLQKPLKFAHVSKALGIPEVELRQLNPVCRTEFIPGLEFPVQLCLPKGLGPRFTELKDSIYKVQEKQEKEDAIAAAAAKTAPTSPEVPTKNENSNGYGNLVLTKYTIRAGDNLGAIAQKFGIPLSELKDQNNLHSDRIKAGDVLKIYLPKEKTGQSKNAEPASKQKPEVAPVKSNAATQAIYTVAEGDNLWAISQKYPGVSADDIMKHNGIDEAIKPGMKLKIPKADQ